MFILCKSKYFFVPEVLHKDIHVVKAQGRVLFL